MGDQESLQSRLIMLAASIAGTMILAWMEVPPDQRMMWTLEAKARAQRWLNRAARRAGHAGMASELRHWPASALAGYGLAYRLARLRDRL